MKKTVKKRAKDATMMVSFRGNEAEVKLWKDAAALAGMSYGRYIREVMNEAARVEIEAAMEEATPSPA
jgi:predicted DNA binding CopG/RHH family protein